MTDDGQHKPTSDEGLPRDDVASEKSKVVDEKSLIALPVRKRSWARWILPTVALVALIVICFVLRGKLRDDVWAYYTDDEGLKVQVEEKKERLVLWEDPQQNLFLEAKPDPLNPDAVDPVNQASERVEAAFSADGTMMVLTRWSKDFEKTEIIETGADLYLSTWNGRTWSRPEPMADLNTKSNERGAAFSRDGKYLYFSSDREGGAGGYDIYVARKSGEKWTAVEPLSDAINSPQNEAGPATSSDDKKLYFSSDRDADDKVHDIFVASRVVAATDSDKDKAAEGKAEGDKADAKPQPATKVAEVAPQLPPLPVFAKAEAVSSLNSDADDIEAALTGRGDHVFLASDRDRDDKTGFNLYLSRVVGGHVQEPQKVNVYIEKGNATDPAVRMEGFDLLFSSDGDLAAGPKKKPAAKLGAKDVDPDADTEFASAEPSYRLYRSTTREVIGYTDMSRWELFKQLLHKIIWWIIAAIAALIALIYLLEKWRDITNLFHKCLAGSVIVHLLLLLLLTAWQIAHVLEGGDPQSTEIALSVDALAAEELAMESEQELVQVARTTQLIVAKNVQDFREVAFNPTEVSNPPVPVVRKTSDQSLLSNFRPSKASTSTSNEVVPQPESDAKALTELIPTELPALKVEQLEVATASAARKVERVDPTKDDFKRDEKVIEQVKTNKANIKQAKSKKIDVQSDSASSGQAAPTTDTGGDTINPTDGLEADSAPPLLAGTSSQVALAANLPGEDQFDAFPRGEKFETPTNDADGKTLSNAIKQLSGKPSLEVIETLGGSGATERAIGMSLDWFSDHQEPDGHWDMGKYGSKSQYNTSGAGLALLCYYGWGIKHGQYGKDSKYPKHVGAVSKALDWMLKQQKKDGDLRGGARMYCHGIATIALCEAYGLTKDSKLKGPATKAVDFIVRAQHAEGGWRYEPGQPGDLSVVGWQYMALHSARMAGIKVPDEVFEKTGRYLDSVGGGKLGGIYNYQGKGGGSPAMVSCGMFLRQLDLAKPTEPRMQESANYIKAHMIKAGNVDHYADYYGTLALYQHQGPIWREWNKNLKQVYVASQITTGGNKGSWEPQGRHAKSGGRILATGLSTLSLEVYYRLLPMYGFGREEDFGQATP